MSRLALLVGVFAVVSATASVAEADIAFPPDPPDSPDPKVVEREQATYQVVFDKAKGPAIRIPERVFKQLQTDDKQGAAAPFGFGDSIGRTIFAGLAMSAAVVLCLMLLRRRQTSTRAAVASAVLVGLLTGSAAVSWANAAPIFEPRLSVQVVKGGGPVVLVVDEELYKRIGSARRRATRNRGDGAAEAPRVDPVPNAEKSPK